MTDEELIEIGETAVSVLGEGAADKLVEMEDILSEHSPDSLRKKLERLEQLEEQLEDLKESLDLNQLRDILKRVKAAESSAGKLEAVLSSIADDLLQWMTDLHSVTR